LVAVGVAAAAGRYQTAVVVVGQVVGSCVALAMIASVLCLALSKARRTDMFFWYARGEVLADRVSNGGSR
jgi:hypothetical protein